MKNRILSLLLALIMVVGVLASCGPTTPPTCPNHGVDADNDGKCDGCQEAITPTPGGTCTHEDTDRDYVCNKCNEEILEGNYGWSTTQLKFALNLHSHNNELSSGSRRYLAGGDSDGSTLVNAVVARNVKAGMYTKTQINYDYWLDKDALYDWNGSWEYIGDLIEADSSTQPDMYSTFLYDMMAASLSRCLANLKTTQQGTNYFSFVQIEDYAETIGDSEGYMMEFMQSLTLSASKMYLLGSDYFIDTVRAFFLVPANVDLLNATGVTVLQKLGTLPSTGAFKDRTGPDGVPDGQFTVDDFIQLIWDREWTYDTIKEYSDAVYVDSDNSGNKSAKDTLGFVLETGSGFSASGVLYTSSFTIIEKELVNGEWNYCYPAIRWDNATKAWVHDDTLDSNSNAEALFTLENKVQDLFNATGVFASGGEVKLAYGQSSDERELQSIRRKFSSGSLLFGGLIITGNLEEEEYSSMKENTDGGFAIAPGPLYTPITENEYHSDSTGSTAGKSFRDYQTLMHNTGRLGGISVNTRKFSQCSAFLDYQSRNSTDILERYYEEKLTRQSAGTENGNDEVMRFIRNHVRSIFDKAFEDAIAFSYSKDNPAATTWHNLIKQNNFQPNENIATNYPTLAVEKQKCLEQLTAEYLNLPEIKAR